MKLLGRKKKGKNLMPPLIRKSVMLTCPMTWGCVKKKSVNNRSYDGENALGKKVNFWVEKKKGENLAPPHKLEK